MSLLRGLLFENLGLKLAALLLATLVYLNVYLDRPAGMLVSFPLQIDELADTLSLAGPVPSAVQAELKGTGKQLLRLRVTEPPVRISLAGVAAGRFERALTAEDLPVATLRGVEIDRLIGPRTIELTIEDRVRRRVPVAPRVEGVPGAGYAWTGTAIANPESVTVEGPRSSVTGLDSVRLGAVRLGGRRDTLHAEVMTEGLPEWCEADPPIVRVSIPLRRGAARTP